MAEKGSREGAAATPILIFSHSPLYKYYRNWNFWTEDADEVQEILRPYEHVTVIHGHTHQMLLNQIHNISFYGMLSTAWPWPYAPQGLPPLTVQMNRADPFDQFDGLGDGQFNVAPRGPGRQHLQSVGSQSGDGEGELPDLARTSQQARRRRSSRATDEASKQNPHRAGRYLDRKFARARAAVADASDRRSRKWQRRGRAMRRRHQNRSEGTEARPGDDA